MKKLLILTRSLSVTEGQGRYSIELIKQLASDYEITVFTSEKPHSFETELNKIDLKIHTLPAIDQLTKLSTYLLSTLRLLPYFLKTDFVHFFSDYPYCTFFFFIPSFVKPRFITAHGTYAVAPLDNRKSRFLLKQSFKVAKRVICISNFTKLQILKRINLKNIKVINNGINLDKFKKVNKKNNPHEKMILSVGNLKHRKGYHISIPSIIQVKKKYPNIKYYIVGSKPDDSYTHQLKEIIRKKNLEKNIIFLQNLDEDELLNLYYKCDLFLLTPILVASNKFEGFGLVYLEANACGKAVIATRDCGAEDAVRDNYNGILVAQNNIQDTSQAIIKILNNNDLKSKLERNGQAWVKGFDWNKVANKYKKVYDSL